MTNAWIRFQSNCRRTYGGAWDVPLDGALPTDEVGLRARLEAHGPVYYFAKDGFVRQLHGKFPAFRKVNLVKRSCLPTRPWLLAFGRMLQGRPVVRFVGDLDPCDLGIFRALATGSPDHVSVPGWPLTVSYGGVASDWIAMWEGLLGHGIERHCIKMESLERTQYRALRDSWPDLPSTIGKRAFRLLEGGRKVEVEAFTPLLMDAKTRRGFVDLLLGGSAAEREATSAIISGSPPKARQAARSLRLNSFQRAIMINQVERPDVHPDNQLAALVVLMKGPGTLDLALLTRIVMNRDLSPLTRAQTAEALGRAMRLGSRQSTAWKRAARTLVRVLREPEPEVRLFAAHALGNAGVQSALPSLRRLARNDQAVTSDFGTVSRAAYDAVGQLSSASPTLHVIRLPLFES
jgi:hypothetical protein